MILIILLKDPVFVTDGSVSPCHRSLAVLAALLFGNVTHLRANEDTAGLHIVQSFIEIAPQH